MDWYIKIKNSKINISENEYLLSLLGKINYVLQVIPNNNEFLEYKALNIEKPCLILSPLCDKSLLLAIKNGAEITVSTNTNIGYIEKVAEELKMNEALANTVDIIKKKIKGKNRILW